MKKKKHIILKIVLIPIALIVLFFTVRHLGQKHAQNVLNSQVGSPFELAEGDSRQHITQAFKLKTTMTDNKGKDRKVSYSTSSNIVSIDEEGNVSFEDVNANKNLVIVEEFKWLGFTAQRDYNCILISSKKHNYDPENVVHVEDIVNGVIHFKNFI